MRPKTHPDIFLLVLIKLIKTSKIAIFTTGKSLQNRQDLAILHSLRKKEKSHGFTP